MLKQPTLIGRKTGPKLLRTSFAFSLTERVQIIGGTWYGGEMKKGMFAMMNYLLPLQGIASMHCSANVGEERRCSGILSAYLGTGKTTLSTDPKRELIGDDEHGWDDDDIFNFEERRLLREDDPSIQRSKNRNLQCNPSWYCWKRNGSWRWFTLSIFDDGSKTENTRVSYPIHHIATTSLSQYQKRSRSKGYLQLLMHFGVLPPVSKLTPEQTKYRFLSGFWQN